MSIRDDNGRFSPGVTGNSKGRPKIKAKKLREVDEYLEQAGVVFTGDIVAYGLKYVEALSAVGLHSDAYQASLKLAPYLAGKVGNVDPVKDTGKQLQIEFLNTDIFKQD